MANRTRRGSLLTVDEVYRQPVGPASDPKSLYNLLLRFVAWRRERNWSETTLKVQTHHSYRFTRRYRCGRCRRSMPAPTRQSSKARTTRSKPGNSNTTLSPPLPNNPLKT